MMVKMVMQHARAAAMGLMLLSCWSTGAAKKQQRVGGWRVCACMACKANKQ